MSGFGDIEEATFNHGNASAFDDVGPSTFDASAFYSAGASASDSADTSAFDTAEMEAALSTVAKVRPEQNFVGAPKDKEEAESKAREHGYTTPVPYDYSAYAARGRASIDEAENILAPVTARSNAAQAARYEWKEEYGDIGPKIPELEKQLFTNDFLMEAGHGRSRLDDIHIEMKVHGTGELISRDIYKFEDAAIHPVVMETLNLMGYSLPTPIQCATIPMMLAGRDIVASAQTGSGKTAAYLIPIISMLMGKAKKLAAKRPDPSTYDPSTDRVRAEPLVLVICPTRELCIQIFDECRRLCYRTMLRPCIAYGGGPIGNQIEELAKGCDIIVSTPGRLKDLISKPSVLSLRRVRYTVIDEADELLHGDWEEDMAAIMKGSDLSEDGDTHYYMFSATFPKEFRKIAKSFMADDYVRIRIGRIGSSHENIKQDVIWVEENKKRDALWDLLFQNPPCRTIVFVNNKKAADMLDDFLFNKGMPSTSIHSDRTQREREDSILSFRQGTSPILITTGLAARGLDIKHVLHVINYDMPSSMYGGIQEYVHRIGRTARIGNEGRATSFCNERSEDLAEPLVKILLENNQEIPDFLAEFKPLDGELVWDDDSDDSDEEDAATEVAEGQGWGAPAAAEEEAADTGFTADAGFSADAGQSSSSDESLSCDESSSDEESSFGQESQADFAW
ncbi:hypothetical protein BLS_005384 [Venturia inaequalis]|uniref:RNA helicase n=1 Tax=Venturia inaequalis TaxID=5025 RepID=A0A8H3V468_VENIN|nr:hypothetical protein BLS_005384 [Venturia inaequalis]RDI89831.1 hypothetical protein Vi05172_g466 [Venturia inaequalis]